MGTQLELRNNMLVPAQVRKVTVVAMRIVRPWWGAVLNCFLQLSEIYPVIYNRLCAFKGYLRLPMCCEAEREHKFSFIPQRKGSIHCVLHLLKCIIALIKCFLVMVQTGESNLTPSLQKQESLLKLSTLRIPVKIKSWNVKWHLHL